MTWEGQGNVVQGLLQQLREDVARLEQVIVGGDVPGRIRRAEAHLMELRNHAEDLQDQVERVVGEVHEATTQARRLDARVLWLERRIRLSETPVWELDDVDAEVIRLATAAEAGYLAQLALLAPARRRELEAAVTAYESDLATVRTQQERALAAAVALAETGYGSTEHRSAGSEFRAARSLMTTAETRSTGAREAAQEARRRLRHDDALHSETAERIESGEQSWATLRVRLRAAVAEAVGTAALLPSWFTTVLGPMPPAEDTDRWMETAVDLLAYRITYRVGDPVVALGPQPGEQASERQRTWWHELAGVLRELQR
jgi:chromosome segregation ATPase